MNVLRAAVVSACVLGMAGGAVVSAQAQPYYPDHPHYWHHDHDWRARRDWRWHHEHTYVAPAPGPYAYYNPPPVYYSPPGGVTLGVTIP